MSALRDLGDEQTKADDAEGYGASPAVMTVVEAARALRCGRNTIYALIAEGRLRAVRLGSRSLRVTRSALEAFLNGADEDSARASVAENGRRPKTSRDEHSANR